VVVADGRAYPHVARLAEFRREIAVKWQTLDDIRIE